MIVNVPCLRGRGAAGDAGVDELDALLCQATVELDGRARGRRAQVDDDLPGASALQDALALRARPAPRLCCRAATAAGRRTRRRARASVSADGTPTAGARAGSVSNPATSYPAATTRRAIRPPMLPRPTIPTPACVDVIRRRYPVAGSAATGSVRRAGGRARRDAFEGRKALADQRVVPRDDGGAMLVGEQSYRLVPAPPSPQGRRRSRTAAAFELLVVVHRVRGEQRPDRCAR